MWSFILHYLRVIVWRMTTHRQWWWGKIIISVCGVLMYYCPCRPRDCKTKPVWSVYRLWLWCTEWPNVALVFGRPYYRSCLWHDVSSVCGLSVVRRLSVTFCVVAKRHVLAKNCLKEWIGNQGQKVHFLGRRHISTSGFAATATETAVFALFLPVQPSNRY